MPTPHKDARSLTSKEIRRLASLGSFADIDRAMGWTKGRLAKAVARRSRVHPADLKRLLALEEIERPTKTGRPMGVFTGYESAEDARRASLLHYGQHYYEKKAFFYRGKEHSTR